MTSMPPSSAPLPAAYYMPPESWPNYDHIITEDGKPVDGFYDEKQMRLLTTVLYESWQAPSPDGAFLAMANVGLFYSFHEPPVVPDVMVSLGLRATDPLLKKRRSYFLWEYGKSPEAVVEIVSGTDGEELGSKRRIYQKIGIPYYIVWDPRQYLSDKTLHCFLLKVREYEDHGPWFPEMNLGVTIWKGEFHQCESTWLRWCDASGNPLPTGPEAAARLTEQAEQEKARAEKLRAQLRAAGIEPQD